VDARQSIILYDSIQSNAGSFFLRTRSSRIRDACRDVGWWRRGRSENVIQIYGKEKLARDGDATIMIAYAATRNRRKSLYKQ